MLKAGRFKWIFMELDRRGVDVVPQYRYCLKRTTYLFRKGGRYNQWRSEFTDRVE